MSHHKNTQLKGLVLLPIFALLLAMTSGVSAADWNQTGGSMPDAAWNGDTPAYTGQTNVGALAGEGGVNGGSASYTIPINVVPGRNGMQPSVSLNYSSDGGSGIAGTGWSLSAGSAISRCGRTVAQDGITDKVHFIKAKDRLCMNGQRLVVVQGTYGNSGAQYRTEINSFAKVIQTGDMDGGSTYFTVTYKNGYKDTFGGSIGSRHRLQGQSKINSWAINKSADVSGNNTMTYVYTSHGHGEYTLASINYTGGSTTSGNRHVEFTYENRPDTNVGYQSGALYASTKRLTAITTKYISTVVKQYRFSYGAVSLSTKNSLLRSAQECGYLNNTAHCLPATKFNWYEAKPVYKLEKLQYTRNGQKIPIGEDARDLHEILPNKDVNGDGTLDWKNIYTNAEGEFKGAHNSTVSNCMRTYEEVAPRCIEADFNHDGMTDSWKIVGVDAQSKLNIAYSVNGQLGTLLNTGIGMNKSKVVAMSDFNGDGYTDIAVHERTGGHYLYIYWHSKSHVKPYSSTQRKLVHTFGRNTQVSSIRETSSVQFLGDYDGNGIADVFVYDNFITVKKNGVFYYKPQFRKALLMQPSQGNIAFTEAVTGAATKPFNTDHYAHNMLFDINSDGLLDLLTVGGSKFYYRINKGNGTLGTWKPLEGSQNVVSGSRKGFVRQDIGINGEPIDFTEPRMVGNFVMDYDQDGRVDMLVPSTRIVSNCLDWYVRQSDGTSNKERICDDGLYDLGRDISVNKNQGRLPAERRDKSVYKFNAAKFKVTGYAADGEPIVKATLVSTDIKGSISNTAAIDAFGNGLTDLITVIGCRGPANGCAMGRDNGHNSLASQGLEEGAYINRNVGSFGSSSTELHEYEVVDRLKSVVNAMDYSVEWDYLPLNSGKAGPSFYTLNSEHLSNTDAYLHFSANLNVVSTMRMSNGIGGMNTTNYRYEDATLNLFGRGFQGFEKIYTDDLANELHTETSYHYAWPSSGQMVSAKTWRLGEAYESVAAITETHNTFKVFREAGATSPSSPPPPPEDSPPPRPPPGPGPQPQLVDVIQPAKIDSIISKEVSVNAEVKNFGKNLNTTVNSVSAKPLLSSYFGVTTVATRAAPGETLFVAMIASGTYTRDLNSRKLLHTNIQKYSYDGYGNQLLNRSTYHESLTGSGGSISNKNESETTTVISTPDTVNWWVNKPVYQNVLTRIVANRSADSAAIEPGTDHQKQVRTTYNAWDNRHRKPSSVTTSAIQGGGQPTTVVTTYNAYANPLTIMVKGKRYQGSNMADRKTASTYSTDGYFLKTLTNAKGHVTTTDTDPKFGQATKVTDPNGQIATTTYDAFGRVHSSKAPGEPTAYTGYFWCTGSNSGSAWCANAPSSKYTVRKIQKGAPNFYTYNDQLNRELSSLVRNFDNTNWYWPSYLVYNNRGLVVQENLPFDNDGTNGGVRTVYYDDYDNLGRLTQKRSPQADNTNLTTKYIYAGFETKIDAIHKGKTLTMYRKYNGLEQLVWTKDANGQYTRYAYDGAGNPISIQDPKANKITTRFNALGQKEWVRDPNAGFKQFKYDSLGELEWEKDANGNVVDYSYDTLGRMVRRNTNGAVSGDWRYDYPNAAGGRKGQLFWEQNVMGGGDRHIKYYYFATTTGGKDYLSYTRYQTIDGAQNDNHYVYNYVDNNYGRLKGMKYNTTGISLEYLYNSLGYPTRVQNASTKHVYREITDQDARGNAIGAILNGNKLAQTATYHPATGQMLSNRVTKTGAGSVHDMTFTYGGFSNLDMQSTTVSGTDENFETFTYDKLQRLTRNERAYMSLNRANDVITYSYDSVGNILTKSDYAHSLAYGSAARNLGGNAGPNAIRAVNRKVGGVTAYAYDANGNQKSGDGRFLTYNEFNKPLSIARKSVTSRFSYGANLMRYKQVKTGVSGGTMTTYYLDKSLEIEKQGSKTIYRHYIGDIAILNKEVVGAAISWKIAYNHKDRLGSVVSLTDHNANVIEHRSYDPFGKPRKGDFLNASPMTLTGAVGKDPHTNRGFTDHEHLDEVQLIHMNGRVFDYNVGRFTSVDPFIQGTMSQAMNPYSYIQNNPLAGTDPSGYAAECGKGESSCNPGLDLIKGKIKKTGSRIQRTVTIGGSVTVTNADGSTTTATKMVGSKKITYSSTGGYASSDSSTMGSRAKNVLQTGANVLFPNAQNVDLSEGTSLGETTDGFLKAGGNLLDDVGNSAISSYFATMEDIAGISFNPDLIPEIDIASELTSRESLGGGVFDVITLGATSLKGMRGANLGKGASSLSNNRVFWSGQGSKAAAEGYALKNGGVTLEMTRIGGFLDKITTRNNFKYLKPFWNIASKNFARGARGKVDVFHSYKGIRVDGVWAKSEYPILRSKGNEIIYHVPR